MNKKNIENKIKNAFEAVTPAKLDDVLGCCAEQMAENREKKAPVIVPLPRRNRVRWAQAGALALVAICVSTAFILNGRRANEIIIGSTDTQNTESVIATHSDSSSESVYVTESESDSTADTTVTDSTDEPVSEPSVDTEPITDPPVYTEPLTVPPVYTEPVTEPPKPVTTETEAETEPPLEVDGEYVPENSPTDKFASNAVKAPDHSENCNCEPGIAQCPLPDPVYRDFDRAHEDVWRYLYETVGTSEWKYKYYFFDEYMDYVYTRLGKKNGEDVYFVTICKGEYRIDCTVPIAFASELKDIKITSPTKSTVSEKALIGEDKAIATALAAKGLSKESVSTVNVSLDNYRQDVIYRVSFYYNGVRHYSEIDAVSGKFLNGSAYDLAPLKKKIDDYSGDRDFPRYGSLAGDRMIGYDTIVDYSQKINTKEEICDVNGTSDICSYMIETTENGSWRVLFALSAEESTETSTGRIAYIYSAANYGGAEDERTVSIEASVDCDGILHATLMTDKQVYKFGIDSVEYNEAGMFRKSYGSITYFGKCSRGDESNIKFFDGQSALKVALEHAGVTDYELVSLEGRSQMGRNNDIIMFYRILFTSGEHKYVYRVDAVSGEIYRYLSGSGKGDVSDVIYTVGDHTGFYKKEMKILFDDVKDEFAAWFDGAKLEEVWYDYEKLQPIEDKYRAEALYSDYDYFVVAGVRVTTGADYNGNYGLKPNTEYEMYCLLNNYYNQRWEAIGYVFE
ncbi:MAG: PepSY domain-containing protein [Clostridia bacterium]|nr:PepSY domain-containing protein [Clostridia bacterium]